MKTQLNRYSVAIIGTIKVNAASPTEAYNKIDALCASLGLVIRTNPGLSAVYGQSNVVACADRNQAVGVEAYDVKSDYRSGNQTSRNRRVAQSRNQGSSPGLPFKL